MLQSTLSLSLSPCVPLLSWVNKLIITSLISCIVYVKYGKLPFFTLREPSNGDYFIPVLIVAFDDDDDGDNGNDNNNNTKKVRETAIERKKEEENGDDGLIFFNSSPVMIIATYVHE